MVSFSFYFLMFGVSVEVQTDMGVHCEGYAGGILTCYGLITMEMVLKYMGTADTAPEWVLAAAVCLVVANTINSCLC